MKTAEPQGRQGYILLEVIVLGVLVLAMAASLRLYRQAEEVVAADSARLAGVYLAQEELARLEWETDNGSLREGEWGWLGDASLLQQDNNVFTVKALVEPEVDNVWRVQVSVSWTRASNRSGSLRYERLLCRHKRQKRGS